MYWIRCHCDFLPRWFLVILSYNYFGRLFTPLLMCKRLKMLKDSLKTSNDKVGGLATAVNLCICSRLLKTTSSRSFCGLQRGNICASFYPILFSDVYFCHLFPSQSHTNFILKYRIKSPIPKQGLRVRWGLGDMFRG